MSAAVDYPNPQLRLDGQRPGTSPILLKEEEDERENLRDHPVTSPTTGQTRQTSDASRDRSSSETSEETSAQSASNSTPTELCPLDDFLGELLVQEGELWNRNENLRRSLRVVGGDNTDTSDTTSHSSTSEGSTTSLGSDRDKDLYFIRYGQLTSVIHRYFRKLEKSHACLHLTARRANHEALRHVERAEGEESSEDNGHAAREVVPQRSNGRGSPLVILRDEELLVYRCALQCAQFPMLSAPGPPEGHSPTPPPPSLPSVFRTRPLEEEDSSDHTSRSPNSDSNNSKATTETSFRHNFQIDPLIKQGSSAAASGMPSQDSVDRDKLNLLSLSGQSAATSSGVPSQDSMDGDKLNLPSLNKLTVASPSQQGGAAALPVRSELHLPDETLDGKRESQPLLGKQRTRTKKRLPSESSILGRQQASTSLDSDDELELVRLVPGGGASEVEYDASIVGREHPFSPMVNRDMLLNLVREAFQQTEDQQASFEATLKQEYSRRSKGEILAKELVGQLQVLENNAHPFYKPKLFVTRNGYDLWLQGEKERVGRLIDKFWHCSLPRPQLWRNFNPIDYHKAYLVLLRKVINAESRTDRKEPVHAGKTPSSPLSATAQRLLTEFGLRYGVGELYRRIIYLDYLAKHFDYEIWYIKHCTEELRAIRSIVPRVRNQVTAVRREMDILRSTIHLLHGQTDNSLTRIDRLFLNSEPRTGVACLIELLGEVLDAELSLFGKKVKPVKDWLVRYLKSGFSLRYERRKQIASAETSESRTVQPFVLTPTLVNSLLLDTRDEVQEYREKFQVVFRPYFDIVPFSKVEFYKHLSNDACSLCARMITREDTRKSIPLEMLGLMYRLNERDVDWQAVIEPDMQQWRQRFQNLAILWIDVLSNQVQKWTVEAVESDGWTFLAFDVVPQGSMSASPSTSSSPMTLERSLGHRRSGNSWHHRSLGRPQIVNSIRQSPFPSPPAPEISETSKFVGPKRVRIGAGSGAFTPYTGKRPPKPSPISEASGAITDSPSVMDTSSSTSLSIAGDYHHSQYLQRRKAPQDSILTFAQKPSSNKASDDNGSPGLSNNHKIEVSVSVYGGSDEDYFASISPEHVSPPESNHSSSDLYQIPEGEAATLPGKRTRSMSDTATINKLPSSSAQAVENGSTGQVVFSPIAVNDGTGSKEGVANGMLGEMPRLGSSLPSGISTAEEASVMTHKFNNLLDKCGAEDSAKVKSKLDDSVANGSTSVEHTSKKHLELNDEVRSKPDPVSGAAILEYPGGRDRAESNLSDEFNRSPLAQRTSWKEKVSTGEAHLPDTSQEVSTDIQDLSTLSTSAHITDETLVHQSSTSGAASESIQERDSVATVTPSILQEEAVGEGMFEDQLKSYLFPVSNSPLDLITMLSRMAHFTGELLNTLVPKSSGAEFSSSNKLTVATEYAPEVTKARKKASERQKSAIHLKTTFLKRLNRIMINSLMLYADNMLCMDLCCWSVQEAISLIGQQKLNNLKRRRDCDEIWGCRHMVEANHGFHPGGLPCHKKTLDQFECVTRDMCIRINNIHVLITVFHSLESHIYDLVRTDSKRPVSAFGYVSSDHSDSTSNMQLLKTKSNKPAPTRTHYQPQSNKSGKTTSTWNSSLSPTLGPMEPDQASKTTCPSDIKQEESHDSPPKQSLECLHYLKDIQNYQLKMIAIRMNKFCKRALSELLGLRLSTVSIEKRLKPIVNYLDRHRVALRKYIYPKCYIDIMENIWDCLLQDLEEEATKLRYSKRPVTDRAQMLIQSLTHLIHFMHNKGKGLNLDILNTTSEYLQGLLNIMTRSTDQLIGIFTKLNTFHFAQTHRQPQGTDTGLIKKLRVQLRSNKKCFSGAEFVSKVVEVGRNALDETIGSTDEEERQSPAYRNHLVDRHGKVIDYNEDYACVVGTYLVEEGIIMQVMRSCSSSNATDSSMVLVTPTCSSEEEDVASSYDSRKPSRGGRFESFGTRGAAERGGARNITTSSESHSIFSGMDTTISHASPSKKQSRSHVGGGRGGGARPAADTFSQPFLPTPDSYYKFVGAEDVEYLSVVKSQILMSSSLSGNIQRQQQRLSTASPLASQARPAVESQDFQDAKKGTLYLVLDLLIQRSRKERVAKQFLTSPITYIVQEQKKSEASVNCDLIFKM